MTTAYNHLLIYVVDFKNDIIGDEMLAAKEGAIKVGFDCPIPAFIGHIFDWYPSRVYTGVIYQNRWSPQLVLNCLEQLLYLRGLALVELNNDRFLTRCLD
nr:hypothetical protein [Fischerella sp. PCC 9605]